MGQKFLPASVRLGFITEQHRLGGSRVTEMHFSQLWRLEPEMKAFSAGALSLCPRTVARASLRWAWAPLLVAPPPQSPPPNTITLGWGSHFQATAPYQEATKGEPDGPRATRRKTRVAVRAEIAGIESRERKPMTQKAASQECSIA